MGDWGGLVARVGFTNASTVGISANALCGATKPTAADCNAQNPFGGVIGVIESLIVVLDSSIVGTVEVGKTCGGTDGKVPLSHNIHLVEGIDAGSEHLLQLFKPRDPEYGGIALRGVVLPKGGSLLPVSDVRPNLNGRFISIGGSKSAGCLMYCELGTNPSDIVYPLAQNVFLTWQSVLAAEFGLQYTPIAKMAQTLGGIDCHQAGEWAFRSMYGEGFEQEQEWDIATDEAQLPAKLVVIYIGKNDVDNPHCYAKPRPRGGRRALQLSGNAAQSTSSFFNTSAFASDYAALVVRLLLAHPIATVVLWAEDRLDAQYPNATSASVLLQVHATVCADASLVAADCARAVVIDGAFFAGPYQLDLAAHPDGYNASAAAAIGIAATSLPSPVTTCDDNHPNVHGHRQIATRVRKQLQQLLGVEERVPPTLVEVTPDAWALWHEDRPWPDYGMTDTEL